jgi:hypothetical protein
MKNRADQIAKMPDDFLTCRSFGHSWLIEMGYGAVVNGVTLANFSYARLLCQRCGMACNKQFDPWLQLVDNAYERPQGYDITGSGRSPNYRAEAREELLTRLAGARPKRRRRSA